MPRILRTMLLFTLLPGLVGCVPSARNDRLKQALTDYDAGQYALAADKAQAAMADSKGKARDEAAYIAGLSEYRMGNLNQAERHLATAAESADKAIAGRASAVLGTIRMNQNRPREAAPLFASAAGSLEGEDARQAARQAATAYTRAGDPAAAGEWSTRAAGIDSGRGAPGVPGAPGAPGPPDRARSQSAVSAPAAAPSASGQFALQVGAFRDREHAERAASDTSTTIARQGLGAARIIASADERGRPLYLVQFGQFDSRTAASDARQRIGKLNFIVAPLAVDG